MKRILSVLLAVLMVLSTTVMAAPTQVSTVETTVEVSSLYGEDTTAELEGTITTTVKPGLNVFTGTTEPLTGENAEKYGALTSITALYNSTLTVATNPDDANDKVLKWHVPPGEGSANYYALEWDLPDTLEKLVGHNYAHVKYDYNKVVEYPTEGGYTYNAANSIWIMHTSGAAENVVTNTDIAANTGWKKADKLLNLLARSQGTQATGTPYAQRIRIQAEVKNGSNTIPTDIYFDNMMMVPAYEFKFYTPDGATLLDTIHTVLDENGNIITKYDLEPGLYGSYYVTGWSTTKGGTAVSSVNLNNENLNFYATEMLTAVTLSQDGELTNEGEKATLKINVIPQLKNKVNPIAATWTIDDSSIATITKNKDGSATLVAKNEGKTKAHVTIGNIVAEYEVSVVFPLSIDVADVKNGKEYRMNPADYTAMLITISGGQAGKKYTLDYVAGNSNMGTFTIQSTTSETRAYYFDLTTAKYWNSASSLILQFTGNATVEEIKFFKYFEPGFKLDVVAEKELLTLPGEETEISVDFFTNLEGEYDEGYELTIEDPDNVASFKVRDDGTAVVRANVGTGYVIVKATSKEDPDYVAIKKIYVDVDDTVYGHYKDFLGIDELDSSKISTLTNSAGEGNTEVSLGEDVLHVSRPTTADGTGGVTVHGTAPGNQKYLVVKTTGAKSTIKVYYHYDSSVTVEANTASSEGYVNEDGTRTYYITLANVPADAKQIKNYFLQISKQTAVDIICMYTTNIAPEDVIPEVKAYTWDFTTTTFTASQNQGLARFNGSTMWASKSYAMINGAETAVQVDKQDKLADGTPIYRISTTNGGNHGSLAPASYPQNLKLADYPYLWFTYRSNVPMQGKWYVLDKDKGGNESGWDSHYISFEQSEEFTTKVFYLPDWGFGAGFNDVLTSIMFPIQGKTVLTNLQQDSIGYYVPVDGYTYSKQEWIEIDEIVIANYNPFAEEEEAPLNMVVNITAEDNKITTEGGSLTLSADVFANKEVSTKAVKWSVDNGSVSIIENDDGTATITAINNGTVTVTATSIEDSTFFGTFEVTVTGQRKKIAAYDFKYLAIGNSYSKHGYHANYSIWLPANEETRGMAASKPELDYYHRVQYHLATGLNGTMQAGIIPGSGLENSGETSTTVTTLDQINVNMRSNGQFLEIVEYLVTKQPNVITVQLSENFQSSSKEVEENFYNTLYGMIDEYRPEKSVVVCITPFGTGSRVDTIKKYAQKFGFYVADVSYVNSYSVVPDKSSPEYNTYVEAPHPITGEMTKWYRGDAGWKYNPYLAWAQYPGYDIYKTSGSPYQDDRAEFRTHPGDVGMEEIATRVFEQFEKAVPAYLDAKYIYVPSSIEIEGADEITELAGTIQLTAVVAPDDSSTDVIWSTDSNVFAEISADGVLTAKNNGTVTVTATSAYDSSVVATKTITISGQKQVYTVTYFAGTTDEVTDLAPADKFANGEYTLSTMIPVRDGYKFLGWSLTEGGETVNTVNVDKNLDIYAVWTLAESWHFDEDGNEEAISFGGFNVKVENGVGTVLSYDEGVSVGDSTLKLDSDNFDALITSFNLSGTDEGSFTLTLELTTTKGKYTYTQDVPETGSFIEYTFDISDAEGTITGFVLKPSAMKCQADVDWIEFVRTSLDEDVAVDMVTVIDSYTINANGNTFEIETLDLAEGTTLTLTNGSYVIGKVTGEGKLAGYANIVVGEGYDGIVSLEVPEKTSEENLRYAEVDGEQFEFTGNKLGFILGDGETKLVQIVEKKTADAITTESTLYYLVKADGATLIDVLSDSMDNEKEVSLRTKEPVGIRFKAGILNTAKVDACVVEYGFVIALERDLINAGAELTLDFNRIATGSAYIKDLGVDVIYDDNGTKTFFTGVLYGIPENSYGVKLVSKTFMKIEIDGVEYVVYGEPVKASAYQIAKLLENEELDASSRELVDTIIDKAENGKDVGFDFGDL